MKLLGTLLQEQMLLEHLQKCSIYLFVQVSSKDHLYCKVVYSQHYEELMTLICYKNSFIYHFGKIMGGLYSALVKLAIFSQVNEE